GRAYPLAAVSAASVATGANVNVIGSNDVVQQGIINGVHVFTCNPGKDTAQNETTIAASGSRLAAGATHSRLYEPSENPYDASAGFYRSADGGATWSAGIIPGLVRADTAAPGPYEAAGDPAVAAGPNGTFWYADIAFDRTDAASAIGVSPSPAALKTWSPHL